MWPKMVGHSFNEAGAIRPRKDRVESATGLLRSCFNEAGAIRPRKVLNQEGGRVNLAELQ